MEKAFFSIPDRAGSGTVPPVAMELSFLTYNIHKGIGNDGRFRLERIIDVLRAANPDFLALQEVDKGVPRSRGLDLASVIAQELGLEFRLGLNVKLKNGHYGNSTLTRFPIVRSYNYNVTWGIKKKRGCLNTVCDIGGREIAVMNYHLGLSAIEQNIQTRKILKSHFLKTHEDLPVVILGDTNDRMHRLNTLMHKSGFRDTARDFNGISEKERAKVGTTEKIATWPSYAPIGLWRLDKIFYSRQFELVDHDVIKNANTRVASDHYPVIAKLRLK